MSQRTSPTLRARIQLLTCGNQRDFHFRAATTKEGLTSCGRVQKHLFLGKGIEVFSARLISHLQTAGSSGFWARLFVPQGNYEIEVDHPASGEEARSEADCGENHHCERKCDRESQRIAWVHCVKAPLQ